MQVYVASEAALSTDVQAVHVSELPLFSVRKKPDAHTAALSPAAVQDTESAFVTASHGVHRVSESTVHAADMYFPISHVEHAVQVDAVPPPGWRTSLPGVMKKPSAHAETRASDPVLS